MAMEEKVLGLLFILENDTINPINWLMFQSFVACLCFTFLLSSEWFKGH